MARVAVRSSHGTITVEGNDFRRHLARRLADRLAGSHGKTTVLGDRSVGVHTGDSRAAVRLAGSVQAQGQNAVGAHLAGDRRTMVVQGTVSATGYR